MDRVIALDESGTFENRIKGCRFIGGVVGTHIEENQIETLLKDICAQFNEKTASRCKDYQVLYPNSLHGSESVFYRKTSSVLDKGIEALSQVNMSSNYRDLEKEFKKEMQERVIEFLSDNGYEIYMFFDPYVGEGFEEFHANSGNMVNPNQGANLYERMAILAMYNQIVYTLRDTAQHYHLHLATRTLENSKYSADNMYETYEVNEHKETKKLGRITTMSTYKTALSALLYDKTNAEEYQNAKYSFYVKSINYHNMQKPTTPYLYLADIVCSYINRIWKEELSIKFNALNENKITSEQLLLIAEKYNIEIRVYDATEVHFRHMLDAVKNCNLVQYYTILYELHNSDEKYRGFYLQYWIPKVEVYLRNRIRNDEKYKSEVIQIIIDNCQMIRGYMGPRKRLPEKGLFIAEKLLAVMEEIKDSGSTERLKRAFFELYDICMSGYNHRGSIDSVKHMIEKCEIYKLYVDAETYIGYALRAMQFYFNSFDFDAVINMGSKIVDSIKGLKVAYANLSNATTKMVEDIIDEDLEVPNNFKYNLAGKVYSSIGQAAAFLGKTATANRYFRNALDEFDSESEDYAITTSYYLHYCIEFNKKEEYEKNAISYFDTKKLSLQLKNALDSEHAFKLFVFVKAFKIFYAKDRSNLNLLMEMIEGIYAKKVTNEHPWELIYKNLYEAIMMQGKVLSIEKYEWIKERALNCIEHPESTIKMIQLGFKIDNILKTQDDAENLFAVDILNEAEMKLCSRFIENLEEQTLEELAESLNKLLTYMYY